MINGDVGIAADMQWQGLYLLGLDYKQAHLLSLRNARLFGGKTIAGKYQTPVNSTAMAAAGRRYRLLTLIRYVAQERSQGGTSRHLRSHFFGLGFRFRADGRASDTKERAAELAPAAPRMLRGPRRRRSRSCSAPRLSLSFPMLGVVAHEVSNSGEHCSVYRCS